MVKTVKEKEKETVKNTIVAAKIVTKSVHPEKNEAKNKALDITLAEIDKQFGKGSVMLLGQKVGQKVH